MRATLALRTGAGSGSGQAIVSGWRAKRLVGHFLELSLR